MAGRLSTEALDKLTLLLLLGDGFGCVGRYGKLDLAGFSWRRLCFSFCNWITGMIFEFRWQKEPRLVTGTGDNRAILSGLRLGPWVTLLSLDGEIFWVDLLGFVLLLAKTGLSVYLSVFF